MTKIRRSGKFEKSYLKRISRDPDLIALSAWLAGFADDRSWLRIESKNEVAPLLRSI